MDFKDGALWRRDRTGVLYRVLGECEMKVPNSGVWITAIRYEAYDNGAPRMEYVRDQADFINNFTYEGR